MSTPCPADRPRPEGGLPVDEEELSRFRAWLVDRGYADETARIWACRIRRAYAFGVGSPDEVDAVFMRKTTPTRCGIRQALQNFDAFRRAGR
jgi:hypothetical protein